MSSGSHLARLEEALRAFEPHGPQLEVWGQRAARVLVTGGRLLACGNGGSAEQAQHLTTELVGRYQDERQPLAALPLTADMAAVTAIGNDYGASPNVIEAALAAEEIGMTAWALTGPGPNPLADACAEAITVDTPVTSTVQEVHLAAIHIMCAAVDAAVRGGLGALLETAR